MHLAPKYINIFLNILLGVAWGISFILFIYGYTSSSSNIFLKISTAFLYFFCGLFFVLLLEAIAKVFEIYQLQKDILNELKKDKYD